MFNDRIDYNHGTPPTLSYFLCQRTQQAIFEEFRQDISILPYFDSIDIICTIKLKLSCK